MLAFDLDGSLAPLVMHRADAAVPPSTAARMTELMRDWTVAVITGRAVDDAAARLNFEPHYLFGNYGAEFHGAGRVWPASFPGMSGPKAAHCLEHCRAHLSQWAAQFDG